MANQKTYTSADIQELPDRDYVRLRTHVYFGSMHATAFSFPSVVDGKLEIEQVEFIPAAYKAVGEILDNSIDEFSQINTPSKQLDIIADSANGSYEITDNGRGIPIDMHSNGRYTPQVALGSLKAGRNFTSDKEIGIIGQNGVGGACTNYCSSRFDVTILRDNKKYVQKFSNGSGTITDPVITKHKSTTTGTSIGFKLDDAVFANVSIPEKVTRNRACFLAMCNPDITVTYNGETFCYPNGADDVIPPLLPERQFYTFALKDTNVCGKVYIAWDMHNDTDPQMFTWVNSSLLLDGGKCNTQFINAFTDKVQDHLSKQATKQKISISKQDVRRGLLIFAVLQVKEPEYDSQAKTRLTAPDTRKEMHAAVDAAWTAFSKSASGWLDNVLSGAVANYRATTDKEAIKEHEKKKRRSIEGLLDATGTDRSKCKILLTEGVSAKGQVCEARDPKTIGALALTGKINNVHGMTAAQVLKMGKVADMLLAIGLTPGKPVDRTKLRYGQIVISTDADFDGDDIFTLLVNLFFTFWPELFAPNQPPVVHRLVAPNVCLVKGKDRVHFPTREAFEKTRNKYKGYEVNYYKGLGSMDKKDWEMILTGETNTLIPVQDDGKLSNTLQLLFGKDAEQRRKWLTT